MQANMDKGYKGIGMEDRIAAWYARNTARDISDFSALAHRVTATLPAGSRILEVAPGPGSLAIEIARRGELSGYWPGYQPLLRGDRHPQRAPSKCER